jgi:hypothetical protein
MGLGTRTNVNVTGVIGIITVFNGMLTLPAMLVLLAMLVMLVLSVVLEDE